MTDTIRTAITDRRAMQVALVRLFMVGAIYPAALTTDEQNVLRHRVLACRTLADTATMMGAGWDESSVRQCELRALLVLRAAWNDAAAYRYPDGPCGHDRTTEYVGTEECDDCGHVWR